MEGPKQVLSVKVSPSLFQRLKKEVENGKVSKFVERAIAKELDKSKENLTTEQKEFQKKLIQGYQAMTKNKKLKEELAI
jgi:hypothetical protein